jgi:hypothetical protein
MQYDAEGLKSLLTRGLPHLGLNHLSRRVGTPVETSSVSMVLHSLATMASNNTNTIPRHAMRT